MSNFIDFVPYFYVKLGPFLYWLEDTFRERRGPNLRTRNFARAQHSTIAQDWFGDIQV